MKCMRRPDIDTVARVHIATQAFLGLGGYGAITRLAQSYGVSRLFVYKLLWQLRLLYELDVGAPDAPEAIRTEVDRHILWLRLEGHGALARISQILKQLGRPFSSVGSIAQRLAAYAQALPPEELTGAPILFLVCDAIFTLGQPMLLTVAPRSLTILTIELVENRAAATWKQPWDALAEAGLITQQTVVAAQGPGWVKGCPLMGWTHHPDLLHLLRPLAMWGERFYRQALAAIAREYERGGVESGRSEAVINKRRAVYEAAKAEAEEQIRRYDHYCYRWTALRHALALFDEPGMLPELTVRKAEIEAIVTLMNELDGARLHQALASCTSGLAGYWGSYQRAEQVLQAFLRRQPREVVQALACGWQLERQATNSTAYRIRKRLTQDAEFYFSYAATLLPAVSEALRKEMSAALDAEVRSSSLSEKVNATLRPLLETCRGQVAPPILDLFAYVHNHRRFGRGKRAGKAPIELLTGKELAKTWRTSL